MIGSMTEHETRREEMLIPFIEVITSAREEHGLTRQALSEKAKFSKKYVTLVETGYRLPPLESMIVLCAAAGVPRKKTEKLVKDAMDSLQWER